MIFLNDDPETGKKKDVLSTLHKWNHHKILPVHGWERPSKREAQTHQTLPSTVLCGMLPCCVLNSINRTHWHHGTKYFSTRPRQARVEPMLQGTQCYLFSNTRNHTVEIPCQTPLLKHAPWHSHFSYDNSVPPPQGSIIRSPTSPKCSASSAVEGWGLLRTHQWLRQTAGTNTSSITSGKTVKGKNPDIHSAMQAPL